MTTVLIVFLFVLQMVSFYVIAMLYMKFNKFNELKRQQDVMMREMEDAVGAYLAEIKDENDRLLKELSGLHLSKSHIAITDEKQVSADSVPHRKHFSVPKTKAVDKYKQSTLPMKEEKEPTAEEEALAMSRKGYSIDEIAKHLKMGKTEVELLLKFRR